MRTRRSSGAIRKLPSGRFQARLRDVDGFLVSLGTFDSKADANRVLTLAEADQARGGWIDPGAGRVLLAPYAWEWLDTRPQPLRPRTRELYEGLLRLHLVPELGNIPLNKLTSARVRRWHSSMLAAGRGQPVTARCYRLLRAILNTAVEDELILKNPCNIRGAGVERSPERPVATVAQVLALAEAVEPRFRALVLTAAFTGLREGELFALRRARVDLLHRTITVTEQVHSLADGRVVVGPPKTAAGYRMVAIPASLVPDLEEHLANFGSAESDGLVFCGAKGAALRRSAWGRKWRAAVRAVGMEGFHFHDLRHTGNTLAAATGASTKELMTRMGHSSPRAALIYQHATRERDEAIAAALSEIIANATPSRSAALRQLGEGSAG